MHPEAIRVPGPDLLGPVHHAIAVGVGLLAIVEDVVMHAVAGVGEGPAALVIFLDVPDRPLQRSGLLDVGEGVVVLQLLPQRRVLLGVLGVPPGRLLMIIAARVIRVDRGATLAELDPVL